MVAILRGLERQIKDEGWLRTARSLPDSDQLSCLLQLNEVWIERGQSVSTHGHADMQILTVIRDGVLGHEDSLGNQVRMLAGEVQLLCCGTGIEHSVRNASGFEPLHMVVAWLAKEATGRAPRCQQNYFSDDGKTDALSLLASADGRDGSLSLEQDVNIYASLPKRGHSTTYRVAAERVCYLQVLAGKLVVDQEALLAGDGARMSHGDFHLSGAPEAEYLLFDLPAPAPD